MEKPINAKVDGLIITNHSPQNENLELKHLISKYRKKINIEYRSGDQLKYYNRGGLLPIDNPVRHSKCYHPKSTLVIDAKGEVILCCNDFNSEIKFGNIKEKKIKGIWNNDNFKKLRTDIFQGQYDLEICKKWTSNKAS